MVQHEKRASPPWHGALFTGALFLDIAWLLTYTLLSFEPIDALGGWNYVVAIGLMFASVAGTITWRGDRYERPTHTGRLR